MKITYIGDDKEPPQETTVFGVKFKINEPVEIEDKKIIAKLKKHNSFKVSRHSVAKSPTQKQEDVSLFPEEKLKDIIVKNNLFLKDKKKSTAIKAVEEFLESK